MTATATTTATTAAATPTAAAATAGAVTTDAVTTAGTAAVSPADRTGARTDEAASVISGARERIDALDDRIIGLVQERMAVSAVVQEARIGSGGRRVNLAREMEILGRYRDALGKPGTTLAMTLLELCRGKI
ncbi:chorismate mutase [Streptomyces sp. NPDC085995]|uniref:chorismate mutase n=1 Tax=Streptomyces sp. NPDC085995 TaxID=3154861 RepID=UPI00343FF6C5